MHQTSSALRDLDQFDQAVKEPLPEELIELLKQATERKKWPVAQLISSFEHNTKESLLLRHRVVSYMDAHPTLFFPKAMVLGVTGTPGTGKSSLISELCLALLKTQPKMSIAVLAVDPSSQVSGGALLGDRTRTQFPVNDDRLFFRSQASNLDLGGMGRQTFHVTRLLRRLFDLVIIETVGIGQSEIEVQQLSDLTCLVMQPLAGDQIQFMKAGIMEIPDIFVVNKCDEAVLAKRSAHMLKASLKMAHIQSEEASNSRNNIFLTSATKKTGIAELSEFVAQARENNPRKDGQEQESYFLRKWIQQAYGEFGLGVFQHFKDKLEMENATFEQKEINFQNLISDFLTHLS